jgi:hypothetical protein
MPVLFQNLTACFTLHKRLQKGFGRQDVCVAGGNGNGIAKTVGKKNLIKSGICNKKIRKSVCCPSFIAEIESLPLDMVVSCFRVGY